MKQIIELSDALAWPIALIVVALISLIIVWRITSSKSIVSLGVKDWFKIETKELTAIPASTENPVIESSAPAKDMETESDARFSASDGEKKDAGVFFLCDNAADLDDAFLKFKEDESFKDDPDFWHCIYVERKCELGVADEYAELLNLSNSHPEWVWPHICMLRRNVRLHQPEAAERSLAAALKTMNQDTRKYVLRDGIFYYGKLFSFDRALQFALDHLKDISNDIDKSYVIIALSEVNKESALSESNILKDIANFLNFQKSDTFDIAYSFGESADTHLIAFARYQELYRKDPAWGSSANNMGVIVNDDALLESDYFEKAILAGDAMGFANLARNLSSAGFVGRAEKLLQDAPQEGNSEVAISALADARAKVATARRKLDDARSALERHVGSEDGKYRGFVFSAFSFLESNGNSDFTGLFISSDESAGVLVLDALKAAIKLDGVLYTGNLVRKKVWYEGALRKASPTSILDFGSLRVLIALVSADEVRMLVFPKSFGVDKNLQIISLERVDSGPVPEPALGEVRDALVGPA